MNTITATAAKLPSIVIVGRPNVGKSTLFNRLTGTRRSIVTDEPGITRDRIYGQGFWYGRPFEIVDTGGLVPEDKAAIPREILRQADMAIADATVLVLVVDARAGLTPLDAELARRLRRTGKPLVVAANKVDTAGSQVLAAAFYELGADVYPVSAEHGTRRRRSLEAITKDFPRAAAPAEQTLPSSDESSAERSPAQDREIQVAIIGRPNVGKSTLAEPPGRRRAVHRLRPCRAPRATPWICSCATTARATASWTPPASAARARRNLLAEKLSVIMARKHLERADVALLVADAGAAFPRATPPSPATPTSRAAR